MKYKTSHPVPMIDLLLKSTSDSVMYYTRELIKTQVKDFIESNTLSLSSSYKAIKGSSVYAANCKKELCQMFLGDEATSELQDILKDTHENPLIDENPFIVDGKAYKYILVMQPYQDPKFCTHRMLAYWIASGIGEYKYLDKSDIPEEAARYMSTTDYYYRDEDANEAVSNVVVRRWVDNEWHEPSMNYMFNENPF